MKYVHLIIRGRVQGVGYRAWCAQHARTLGLTGWVRNRADGAVEAVLAGPVPNVDQMAADCRSGPPGARVDEFELWETSQAALAASGWAADFRVIETL